MSIQQAIYKNQLQAIFALFFISPILSLLQVIKNYRAPYAKNIVWLFTIFYGLTVVISNDGLDANRYADKLVSMNKYATDFESFQRYIYDGDTSYVDIVLPLVTFVVSLFTQEAKFLFAIFAVIFGYFFSRNVWFLIENSNGKLQRYSIIILIVFIYIAGIWRLINFRWWTALHVFIFGIMPYLYYNDKKHLLYCLFSCLIHFSFALPCAALLGYLLLGNRLHLYFVLFTISFFVSNLDLHFVRDQLAFLPDMLQQRTRGYTNLKYAESRQVAAQSMNWYATAYITVMGNSLNFLIFYIYIKFRDHIYANDKVYRTFCFTLFIFAVTNTVSSIPSVWRFMSLSHMMGTIAIFFIFQYNKYTSSYKNVVLLLTPCFLLFIVVTTRTAFDTIGINTIMGNVVSALLLYEDYALIELIK